MRGRRQILLGGAALVTTLACSHQDDGVVSIAFQLEAPPPSETRTFPPAAEVGFTAFDVGRARGVCSCAVAARAVTCTFEGLPTPTGAAGAPAPPRYELSLLLWYGPLTARFDGRAIERKPGGDDPDRPPPPPTPALPRALLGPVAPDPVGIARREFPRLEMVPLDRVVGGELHVVATREDGSTARYLVIDGRVGNLVVPGGGTAPPPPQMPGGHIH
jgi:hypothetical protein